MELPGPEERDALIEDAVARALAGEASLEVLISEALFGRRPRGREPAWPREAMEIWLLAVRRWTAERRRAIEPTVERAWDVFTALAPDPAEWWQVPGATWPVIARRLGTGSRTAHYYLHDVQGWRLTGRPAERSVRLAPCIGCRVPFPAALIHERRCPCCT